VKAGEKTAGTGAGPARKMSASGREALKTAAIAFLLSRFFFAVLVASAALLSQSDVGTHRTLKERASNVVEFLGRSVVAWDGAWYIDAATRGFGPAGVHPDTGQSTRAFFPLLPASIWVGSRLGLSPSTAGTLVTNVAFGVGLSLIYVLVAEEAGRKTATRAVWVAAFSPFGWVFSMVYAESVVFLLAAWALLLYRRGRLLGCALALALAALARPNGIGIAVGVAIASILEAGSAHQRLGKAILRACAIAGPGAISVLGWLVALGLFAGNLGAFFSAKEAWVEVSPLEAILRSPTSAGGGMGALISGGLLLHVAVGAVGAILVVRHRSELGAHQVLPWLCYVAPALLFGIVGLGRYAWTVPAAFTAGAMEFDSKRGIALSLAYVGGAMAAVATLAMVMGRLVP
jgi:hypothetical protein